MTRPAAAFRSLRAVLAGAAVLLAAASAAFAQLGPYEIHLAREHFKANLVKRERDGQVWVRRIAPNGDFGPMVGYAAADIQAIEMPRPAFFTNIEALLELPRIPAPQAAKAKDALDKFVLQTRPFRDLPGVVSDEGIYLRGRLFDRTGKFDDALRDYEDLRGKTPPSPFADAARIRSGICHAHLTNSLEAIECLAGVLLPEDDEPLLSEMLFALGDSYKQVGNWDNALMTYLTLSVFFPYAGNNELRALTRTLPCYAELKEWIPLYQTIQDILSIAPDSPAAAYARDFAKRYKKELGEVGEFVEGERVVDDIQATAVEGTTAATEAPDHTQLNISAPPPPPEEEIEYPDELL